MDQTQYQSNDIYQDIVYHLNCAYVQEKYTEKDPIQNHAISFQCIKNKITYCHAGHVMMKRIFTKEPSKPTSEAVSPSYVFVAAPGPKSDDEEETMPET